jgi:hypothetical protein
MDSQRFDELTRSLAGLIDRRRALKLGVGTALASTLAARRSPVRAGEPDLVCNADPCTPGELGDDQCRQLGGDDCLCVPDIQAAGGVPTGSCGIVSPLICSPEECIIGEEGDAKCQELGGDDCLCVAPSAQLRGGPAMGICGERPCEPLTCEQIGAECGEQSNGCGDTQNCGTCPPGFTCDNGLCREDRCPRESKAEACAGLQCGTASDGCGGEYNCGNCPKDSTCIGNRCKKNKKKPGKRCPGNGLSGHPCNGKCPCKKKRRCHNGNCCQTQGDGSWHCNANSDCCPGLTCVRRKPGQHRVCVRKPIGRATIPANQLLFQ